VLRRAAFLITRGGEKKGLFFKEGKLAPHTGRVKRGLLWLRRGKNTEEPTLCKQGEKRGERARISVEEKEAKQNRTLSKGNYFYGEKSLAP